MPNAKPSITETYLQVSRYLRAKVRETVDEEHPWKLVRNIRREPGQFELKRLPYISYTIFVPQEFEPNSRTETDRGINLKKVLPRTAQALYAERTGYASSLEIDRRLYAAQRQMISELERLKALKGYQHKWVLEDGLKTHTISRITTSQAQVMKALEDILG